MLQIEELLKDTMKNLALNVTGSPKLIRLARHRNSHGIARLCIWILYSRISHYNNPKYERKNSSGSTTSAQKLGKTTSTTTHLQAKNIQESVYKCAAGQKGVIISPGNFKISADKKNGKWSGTISIKGSTGEKSGHIHSSTGKGISFSFTGNLDTRNTLCHFPGLQFAGTGFQTGIFTCGTVKTVKYTETSTGNANTFKVRITCS